MQIIDRYILRGIALPFLLGLALFTLLLLIARILKLVELVVSRGVPLIDVFKLFGYILPTFLEVAVPMAFLLGVLVALGRMSSDSEIIALQSSGVSIWGIARPILLFAFVICVCGLALSTHLRPWANAQLRSHLYALAKQRASAGIKERVFTDDFPGLVLYVDHVHPPGTRLEGLLIADTRDGQAERTILAQEGFISSDDATQVLTLRLSHGSVHAFDAQQSDYQRTDFATYDIHLDLSRMLADMRPAETSPDEMTLSELSHALSHAAMTGEPAHIAAVEWHRRFAIPFASLAFVVVGIPLGIRPARGVHSRGFSLSLGLILFYYLLLKLGEGLGENGTLPALVAMWLPNSIVLGFGLLVFIRTTGGHTTTGRSALLQSLITWLRHDSAR